MRTVYVDVDHTLLRGGHALAAFPRTTPNDPTLEARWVTPAELRSLPLRSPEVLEVLLAVGAGCPVVPWAIWDATGVFG